MTRSEIEAILAGTKGVTPGPWTVGSWRDYVYSIAGENKWEPICRVQRNGDEATDDNRDVIDAAHIARLDPQTVSTLCTALLESMDRVEELEKVLEPFALVGEVMSQQSPEDRSPWVTAPDTTSYASQGLTFGDFRAARKSLGGSNER
jgi:hypothetical protein